MLPNTIYNRERCILGFMAWLGSRSVLEVAQEDIQLYLDGLKLKASSRTNYLSHFHALYRWASLQGLIDEVPTARIPRPRRRRRLPRPIADADLLRAIERAPGQVKCFLLLAGYAGLRAQEIAGLAGEDVDREAGVLTVRHGKGERDRTIPLHPLVEEALVPRLTTGPLFRSGQGLPLRPHNVSHASNRYLKRQGIMSSLHCLRHAFATGLYRMTLDIRLCQEVLGHSSPTTTAIYAGYDPASSEAVRRLEYGSKAQTSDPATPDEAA